MGEKKESNTEAGEGAKGADLKKHFIAITFKQQESSLRLSSVNQKRYGLNQEGRPSTNGL